LYLSEFINHENLGLGLSMPIGVVNLSTSRSEIVIFWAKSDRQKREMTKEKIERILISLC